MNCPRCSGATKVIETRQKTQQIRRRRKCLECGYRFTTYEISEVLKARYEQAERTLAKKFG